MSLCTSVQVCVRRGGRAEERVIVEALEGLQGQSEASSSFGGPVWSLSQLQNHLDSDEEKITCLHIEHFFNNLTTKLATSGRLSVTSTGWRCSRARSNVVPWKKVWRLKRSRVLRRREGVLHKSWTEKRVDHDMKSNQTEQLVDTGACGVKLNFWEQYGYTLGDYLSY